VAKIVRLLQLRMTVCSADSRQYLLLVIEHKSSE